jgi:hypothetical protein
LTDVRERGGGVVIHVGAFAKLRVGIQDAVDHHGHVSAIADTVAVGIARAGFATNAGIVRHTGDARAEEGSTAGKAGECRGEDADVIVATGTGTAWTLCTGCAVDEKAARRVAFGV